MSECSKPNPLSYKFLITIVKKGLASRIVKATRKVGAEGGTILYGIGTGIHEHASFWGIPVEPEKEIILTLVSEEHLENVLAAIVAEGKLEKPGTGIGFVIDTLKIAGIAHRLGLNPDDARNAENEEIEEKMDNQVKFDLIVTVVNKGHADVVVDASKRAGAEGGTIIYGRGTGIHEQAKLFSIQIEPEKELVLTLIDRSKTDQVLHAIMEAAELNKPNHGIAFVLPVARTVGINHELKRLIQDQQRGLVSDER
jgi:nitrogen regulatory protein PII